MNILINYKSICVILCLFECANLLTIARFRRSSDRFCFNKCVCLYKSKTKMNCSDEQNNLSDLVINKIKLGEELIRWLDEFKKNRIEGSQKLLRKINMEITFLKKVHKSQSLKKEHLQCSNLTHFSALINTLKTVENCQSINKIFLLNDKKITIDIVSDGGLMWIKVVARNPKSVSQICMGNASYGVKSIFDQAEEYLECSKIYPCLFQTPKVVFIFTNGISSNIAATLESNGITIKGVILDSDETKGHSDIPKIYGGKIPNIRIPYIADLSTNNISDITKVNLDVSAMLAYCSSVTNGSADMYDFDVPVLKQQAEWERLRPQKLILEKYFKDKNLYCCETARDNFINIVETVGGINEKIRAKNLLEQLTVLPDGADSKNTKEDDDCNEIFNKVQFTKDKYLKLGGKIKQRSLIIFTFGDRIRAVTVTANDGFVRAAKQQGIHFVVFVHESRALTELKEKAKAIPIVK